MGFSLQMFMSGLLGVINAKGFSPEQKYYELSKLIEDGAKYAEECGQIKLPKDEKTS